MSYEAVATPANQLSPVAAAREVMFNHLSQETTVTTLLHENANSELRHTIPLDQQKLSTLTAKDTSQDLMAMVRAGRELFGVVRAYDHHQDDKHFVLTRVTTERKGAEIVGVIGPQDWLEVGRTSLSDRHVADVDDMLSRRHFKIKIGAEGLIVEDEHSANGTDVMARKPDAKGNSEWAEQHRGNWSVQPHQLQHRLDIARELARNNGRLSYDYKALKREAAGNSYFYKGYHVIGQDTPVSGGVDFQVKREPEGVVIDGPAIHVAEVGRESPNYQRLYNTAKAAGLQFAPPGEKIAPHSAIEGTYQAVQKLLPYSPEQLLATHEQMREQGIDDGTVVDLGDYIGTDIGAVCFEQTLAAAKALEMLKERDGLKGTVSIRRRQDWQPREEEFGGHAWIRFTAEDGTIFISDPAQDVRGRLVDILSLEQAKPERERTGWHYLEDNEAYQGPELPLAVGSIATRAASRAEQSAA